jgi:hypothetical protein
MMRTFLNTSLPAIDSSKMDSMQEEACSFTGKD